MADRGRSTFSAGGINRLSPMRLIQQKKLEGHRMPKGANKGQGLTHVASVPAMHLHDSHEVSADANGGREEFPPAGGVCELGTHPMVVLRASQRSRCRECNYESVFTHAFSSERWKFPRRRGPRLPAQFPDPHLVRAKTADDNGYKEKFDLKTKRWVWMRSEPAKKSAPVKQYFPGNAFDPAWLSKVVQRRGSGGTSLGTTGSSAEGRDSDDSDWGSDVDNMGETKAGALGLRPVASYSTNQK